MKGFVWLTGAGCHSREFLTLEGLNALKAADAVVYDDLLAEELLDFADLDAEKIYVGKRLGRHSMPQEEINALLVSLAGAGRKVCRLKGGDAFVFGRGGEEALALKAAGLPYTVVPGVSSAVTLPEIWGIPLTHRGLSRGFHVVTAHTAAGSAGTLRERLKTLVPAAAAGDTLVFLMGLTRLRQIADILMEEGLSPDLPAAVLGTSAVRGTLSTIAARAEGFPGPAVIVAGETAGLDLRPAARPLDGLVIGLTGTPAFQARLREALLPYGGTVISLQKSQVTPCCEPAALARALDRKPTWLSFTSPNGARVFFSLFYQFGDVRALSGVKFAAVGNGTAEALASYGIKADLVPAEHHTAALGEALASAAAAEGEGAGVLLLGAENASRAPELALEAAGVPYERLSIYRLEAGPAAGTETDYLLFGSAGGVENYLREGGLMPRKAACCIGQYTAGRAEKLGFERLLTAEDASAEALAAVLAAYEAREQKASETEQETGI